MKQKLTYLWKTTKNMFSEFGDSNPMIYASSIAFFTIFAMPAILVLIILTSGNLFGEEAITNALSNHVQSLIGNEGADQIEKIVANAHKSSSGVIATIVSAVTLFLAATTVFTILQNALNRIWHVKPKPRREWLKMLKDRATSFAIVICLGFLLAVSLALDAFVTAFSNFIQSHLFGLSIYVIYILNFVLSFALLALIFAMIFKILPDARVRWKDVWVGTFITTGLFVAGKFLIGFIIGKTAVTSAYGAAGSVIVILLWVYFSTAIVLLGAEITQVYAREAGAQIRPSEHAVRVSHEEYIVDEDETDKDQSKDDHKKNRNTSQ